MRNQPIDALVDDPIDNAAYSLPLPKRIFDVVVCLLTSPTWLPVLVLGSLLLLIKEGRPVFYVSKRRVCGVSSIRLWKFRTMVRNAADLIERDRLATTNGTLFLNVLPDSSLYTGIGRIFERLQFTELPQMLHILKGQMSLVGARPLPEGVAASLEEAHPFAGDRFLIPCGLTGPVQLVGRNYVSDEQRLRLEIAYCNACINNYSIRMDLHVLTRTVLMVLGLRNPLTVPEAFELIQRYESASPAESSPLAEESMAQEG